MAAGQGVGGVADEGIPMSAIWKPLNATDRYETSSRPSPNGPDRVKTHFLRVTLKSGSVVGHGITHQAHERVKVFETFALAFL
jgi:hypothetical protein